MLKVMLANLIENKRVAPKFEAIDVSSDNCCQCPEVEVDDLPKDIKGY